MKRSFALILFSLVLGRSFAQTYQTNLLSNHSFESTNCSSNWFVVNPSSNLWCGPGYCNASDGSNYLLAGDAAEQTGVNNLIANTYQTVSLPSNSNWIELYFDLSINTSEGTSTRYDSMVVNLRSTSGALLQTLLSFDNGDGDYGIPGCQSWLFSFASIPSNYYGQTVRLSFEFATDNIEPTIFRIDKVELIAEIQCNYTVSTNSFVAPDHTAQTYNNIATVTCPSNCTWDAQVTQGNTWITTSSSGSGNGIVSITLAENTSTSLRIGEVNVEGNQILVEQPGRPSSLANARDAQGIRIFPNPSRDKLNIAIEEFTSQPEYLIVSSKGKQCLKGILNESNPVIDLNDLASGLYFIQLVFPDGKSKRLSFNKL